MFPICLIQCQQPINRIAMLNKCRIIIFFLSGCLFLACSTRSHKISYEDAYDPFADEGQYNMPIQKFGKQYWTLLSDNPSNHADKLTGDLLSESIVGLMALAVNEDRSQTMAWMKSESKAYLNIKKNLPMEDLGEVDAWEFLQKSEAKEVIKGYILYDVDNHESVNVSAVAAHVFGGVMIEKNDKKKIEKLGYAQLFDASLLTLQDAWDMFRDKCSNKALVLMPALTSNQRSTAISARMMIVNLNKVHNDRTKGNNKELIVEILQWLQPLSPVFGWEHASGEDEFVRLVSSSGNLMVPYDWAVNTPIMWADYKNRQTGLVEVTDPAAINYGDAKHYMSFYMSDGDNVQWMINSFDNQFYFDSEQNSKTKMTFGFPVVNLSMISPDHYAHLLAKQNPENSLMESLGGGYYYADEFGESKDRTALLNMAARHVASHMRQHRNKVLALVCMDALSIKAEQAYKSFVLHNDDLIGIVVIQYTPYAGGKGEILWAENSKGWHIPIITVRYSIWNYGEGKNGEAEGTPAYIASKYNEIAASKQEPTFSVTSVHAWSNFTASDDKADITIENTPGGNVRGVGSAALCQDKLSDDIKIVNVEELIWQLRMHAYPDETNKILNEYK